MNSFASADNTDDDAASDSAPKYYIYQTTVLLELWHPGEYLLGSFLNK